ncbi:MAG TPA: hypothetical protein VLH12_13555 [Usitatibacter sp.]|nr:hypothetical protein [Usitatibacter sp.]
MWAILLAAFVNASVGGVPIAIMEPEGQVALANREAPYYKSVTAPGVNGVLAVFARPEEAAALDAGAPAPRREWSFVSGLQRDEPISNEFFRSKVVPAIEAATIEGARRESAKERAMKVEIEQMIRAYSKSERHVCHGVLSRVETANGGSRRIVKILGSVNVRDRLVTLALSRVVESESDIASAKAKCAAWAEAMVNSNR